MKYVSMFLFFVFFSCAAMFPGPRWELMADTIYVPGDYSTIQAAIDASSSGDTIIVSNGTYGENIKFQGKNVTLKSANGAANCEIEGQTYWQDPLPTVVFDNGELNSAVLDGFTITGGQGMVVTDCPT
jgi:hypothetical protein